MPASPQLDIPNLDRHLRELAEQSHTIIANYFDRDTTAAIRAHVDGCPDSLYQGLPADLHHLLAH